MPQSALRPTIRVPTMAPKPCRTSGPETPLSRYLGRAMRTRVRPSSSLVLAGAGLRTGMLAARSVATSRQPTLANKSKSPGLIGVSPTICLPLMTVANWASSATTSLFCSPRVRNSQCREAMPGAASDNPWQSDEVHRRRGDAVLEFYRFVFTVRKQQLHPSSPSFCCAMVQTRIGAERFCCLIVRYGNPFIQSDFTSQDRALHGNQRCSAPHPKHNVIAESGRLPWPLRTASRGP